MKICADYKNLKHGNSKKIKCIINIPSDFEKEHLIYLQEIGEQHILFSDIRKDDTTISYLFFIVTNGKGKLEYEDTSYIISTGHCVFLNCRKSYRYYPLNDEFTIKYIYFTGFHMEAIYKEFIDKSGLPCFRSDGLQFYIHEWQRIYDIAVVSAVRKPMPDTCIFERPEKAASDVEMYTALISLINNLIKSGENAQASAYKRSHRKNVENVKKYLEENYHDKITLDTLSETFFINKFYLTRLFREQYGTSIGNYLMQIRITHVKNLLLSTDMPIKTICRTCGFTNVNYFYKVFHKYEGISPGKFQKMNKEEEVLEIR